MFTSLFLTLVGLDGHCEDNSDTDHVLNLFRWNQ